MVRLVPAAARALEPSHAGAASGTRWSGRRAGRAAGAVPGCLLRTFSHHIGEQFPHTNTGVYTLDDAVRYDAGVLDIGDEPVVIDVDPDVAAR